MENNVMINPKYLVKYTLNVDDSTIAKEIWSITKVISNRNGNDIHDFYYKCEGEEKSYTIGSADLLTPLDTYYPLRVTVMYVDNEPSSVKNDKEAKQLILGYLNEMQVKNEQVYNEKTTKYRNNVDVVENMFENKAFDFIEHIKRQAKQCSELLSSCDNIDTIRKLGNWGYSNQEVMIDLDDNGLLPLNEAFKVHGLVDNYEVCSIQLETFENLGTVLYNFKEEKLYFSVYKGDDEYAIIEDTTLETLEEDYQDYLDKENMER